MPPFFDGCFREVLRNYVRIMEDVLEPRDDNSALYESVGINNQVKIVHRYLISGDHLAENRLGIITLIYVRAYQLPLETPVHQSAWE